MSGPVPAMAAGLAAVVTGAASGIGLAAARRLAGFGMKVCLVDVDAGGLERAASDVEAAAPGGASDVMAVAADVSRLDDMTALRDRVIGAFGDVGLLMNNAVIRDNAQPTAGPETWRRAIDVNLWGVVNGVQAFVQAMIAAGRPAMVVNVGSKQGITNPPQNPPYNVAKAAVKAYTELLQHELRNTEECLVTAHLLVPGMTTTGTREHRPGAWWPDQVIDFMMAALGRGDFYIICPDGEVTPEIDRKRILWAAGDMTKNRPALSRWHPDFTDAFDKFGG